MTLGKLIRLHRENKHLTLRQLERETGISNALICQIETEHIKNPSFTSVVRLCEVLDVPLGIAADLVSLKTLKGVLRGRRRSP